MTSRRSTWCVTAIVALALAAVVGAQQPGPPPGQAPGAPGAQAPGRAMTMQQMGPASPEILPDNRVTFNLMAPNATEALLNGDWPGGMRQAMTKDDKGVWSITVGPLTPELWGYTFSVNGVRTLDPRNGNTKRDGTRIDNLLLISGPESELYEVKDVPHGNVGMVWYDSPTLKLKRRMYVYTPPGYESSQVKYPVFYLLHGGGGDEDAWFTLGRTSQILDNLIAAGRAKPMIVVMTNGNSWQKMAPGSGPVPGQVAPQMTGRAAAAAPAPGAVPGAPPAAAPAPGAAPAAAPGAQPGRGAAPAMSPEMAAMMAAFPESLVKDVIPFIEKHYRALPGKDNRAIAGLSMGGMHTVSATNGHPGTFGYIGVWSAGTRQNDEAAIKQFQAVKTAGVKLYHVGCGLDDKMALTGSQTLVEILKKVDMKYVFRESPGGHTWFNWRIYLKEFAPMLFR
jgi:enterochelin esterase-like enzyme